MSIYPEAFAAHLDGDTTTVCHCWRLTRRDEIVRGFTDHDRELTVDGSTFKPYSGFSATEARDTLGLAIDTVDVEGALSDDDLTEGDIASGLYDDATVETFLVNWAKPTQFAKLRSATIGKITRRDNAFVAELKSRTHSLDQIRGRVIARTCDAQLGDARCGFDLDQPGFSAIGTVVAATTGEIIRVSGLATFSAGWFGFGTIDWISGPLGGRRSYVTGHTKSVGGVDLTLQPGDGGSAETGDTFTIRAGCDKSFEACKAKFANGLNFQGFPHLPGNDAAYGYVSDGAIFDGSPLVP